MHYYMHYAPFGYTAQVGGVSYKEPWFDSFSLVIISTSKKKQKTRQQVVWLLLERLTDGLLSKLSSSKPLWPLFNQTVQCASLELSVFELSLYRNTNYFRVEVYITPTINRNHHFLMFSFDSCCYVSIIIRLSINQRCHATQPDFTEANYRY